MAGLSFADGEYGLPALVGAGAAIVLGPLAYALASRYRRPSAARGPESGN